MLFMQIKYHDPSLLLTKCILLVGDAQPKAVFDYFYTADGGADVREGYYRHIVLSSILRYVWSAR